MQTEQQITNVSLPAKARRMGAGVGVAAILTGVGFVAYFDPTKDNFFPVCPLYSLTGYACPGCGMTRGFHALFHGDVLTAIDFNALIPVWCVIFGYLFVSLVLVAVRGRGLSMWMVKPWVLSAFLLLLLSFGVLRNIPVYPFTILFP